MPNAVQGALQVKVGGGAGRILDGTSEVANGALGGHRIRVGIHLSTLARQHRTEKRYANSSRENSMEQSGALHKPPLAARFPKWQEFTPHREAQATPGALCGNPTLASGRFVQRGQRTGTDTLRAAPPKTQRKSVV